MSVKVELFSGFLGAGKTQLIKKLIEEGYYNENIAIIENEFGEVGIDGSILKESNIEVKEINSGCICCEVSGDFGDAVFEVLNKYNPDTIIIEPSGVAKLSEILKTLDGIKFQDKIHIRNIFTLIDIKNYDIYLKNFKEFYENQIKKANKIVLSRTQFVDNKKINNTIESLKTFNNKAEIIYKPWNELLGIDINRERKIIEEDLDLNKNRISLLKSNNNKIFKKEAKHNAKEVFESYPIDLMRMTSTEELQKKFQFIANNDKYGKVIRAKGVIEGVDGGYYQFDYVPNEFKARKIKWSNRKVVSIIGSELNKKELNALFG